METVSTSFFSVRKCRFIKIDMFRGMVSILTEPSLKKCQSRLFPPSRFVPINSKSSAPIRSNFLRIMSVCPLQRGICCEAGWRRDGAALHVAPLRRLILFGGLFGVFAARTRHKRESQGGLSPPQLSYSDQIPDFQLDTAMPSSRKPSVTIVIAIAIIDMGKQSIFPSFSQN